MTLSEPKLIVLLRWKLSLIRSVLRSLLSAQSVLFGGIGMDSVPCSSDRRRITRVEFVGALLMRLVKVLALRASISTTPIGSQNSRVISRSALAFLISPIFSEMPRLFLPPFVLGWGQSKPQLVRANHLIVTYYFICWVFNLVPVAGLPWLKISRMATLLMRSGTGILTIMTECFLRSVCVLIVISFLHWFCVFVSCLRSECCL